MSEIPKNYNPQNIENKIYTLWEKGNFFSLSTSSNQSPFVIIMPPPNANASLHIGSAVFVTLEDIMIRYNRMKGKPTLWVPGTDHAGIMTQIVYEKKLAKQGKTRQELGRKNFYEETYKFTIKNKKLIENQLRRLGASCDWSRNKFTLDPKISESVYYTFKKMYDDNFIYRGNRIINWCPRCSTAISNIEIKYKPHRTKLWYLRYPILQAPNPKSQIANKSKIQNPKSKTYITVATTRPETMLGDTAVAVNPKDKKYKDLVGQKVILPLANRKIPIIADRLVESEFGTGAVKITPAHSIVDNKIAKEHKLETINVIGEDGKITKEGGKYAGLTVIEARDKIVKDLKQQNLLEKEEDYEHSLSLCDRCDTPVEPLISRQWFVKMDKLAQPAIKVVKANKIKFIPDHYKKIYLDWMEKIEDWCISRQLWWGHRIPVWYCGNCNEIMVDVKKPKKCKKCKNSTLHQDPDSLDTWFSSGQWPFTVFGWPEKTKDFKEFYPTTIMETGWDILFFWVARMIMLGLYCTKKIPFKYVYLHGLVRDEDHQKMSKSKNNVINPLGVIDLYGADALRMALIFGTSAGRDIVISEEKIIAQRRFSNKLWNAARFVLQNLEPNDKILKINPKKLQFTKKDKWILSELNNTIKEVDQALQNFKFHIAAEKLYEFFWHAFCDKTIENVKDRIKNAEDKKGKLSGKWVLFHVFLDSLKLLHPFMPFITEEIYQMLPEKPKKALIIENWPQ